MSEESLLSTSHILGQEGIEIGKLSKLERSVIVFEVRGLSSKSLSHRVPSHTSAGGSS